MRLGDQASRRWLARTLAWSSVVLLVLYGAAYLAGKSLGPMRRIGQTQGCMSNVRLLARAFALYADDYEDRFPPASRWMDASGPYVVKEQRFRCPAVMEASGNAYGYAASRSLGGVMRAELEAPGETRLLYDSTLLGRNASDSAGSLPIPGRHVRRAGPNAPWRPANVVAYADGGARLEWRP